MSSYELCDMWKSLESKSRQRIYAIIDFHATWCGPCKKFAPKFKELRSQYPDIIFANYDVDEYPKLADQLEISSVPTFILVDIRKMEIYRRIDGVNEKKITEYLKRLTLKTLDQNKLIS